MRAFLAVALLATGPATVTGGSHVTKLVFKNWCSKDIYLDGWNQVIAAGATAEITSGRPSSQRIQWKYTDGQQFDFIELNCDWSGPGSSITAHPSYSSYNGFNMASKYEALNPNNGQSACQMRGAAVTYNLAGCPSGPGGGYLCRGSPDCTSEYSHYIKGQSFSINSDGTFTPFSKDMTYGQNYANFWCREDYGFKSLVATLVDCVDKNVPIMFVITTCTVHSSLENSTATVHV